HQVNTAARAANLRVKRQSREQRKAEEEIHSTIEEYPTISRPAHDSQKLGTAHTFTPTHSLHPRVTEPEIITLPDARRMAVHHFAHPGGPRLFFFPRGPSDATMGPLLDSSAQKFHSRGLAPDRPGRGRSAPKLHRPFADWPADVHAIAAHYGLGK